MSPEEEEAEIAKQISALGEQIKAAKTANKPKEEWEPLLQEMLSLKAKYKQVTGKDCGPPRQEKKSKATATTAAVANQQGAESTR